MSYTPRTLEALKLVMDLHHDQKRKGTDIPYITHLWAVAAIVGENGGDEDQVIGALLHDIIEDQGDKITLEKIIEQFGNRVEEIVKGCTDADSKEKAASKDDPEEWRKRKQRYIDHLRPAPPYVKLVSAADKLHNARAIVADLRCEGPNVWKRFKAGADDQLWYYRGIVGALKHEWSSPVLDELDRMVEDMARLA